MTNEFAWAIGIFEGEGTIRKPGRRLGIRVTMTDYDIIERLQKVLGGHINGPYTNGTKPDHKDVWYWAIDNRRDVRACLSKMLPYLGHRRAHAALNLLDHIELTD